MWCLFNVRPMISCPLPRVCCDGFQSPVSLNRISTWKEWRAEWLWKPSSSLECVSVVQQGGDPSLMKWSTDHPTAVYESLNKTSRQISEIRLNVSHLIHISCMYYAAHLIFRGTCCEHDLVSKKSECWTADLKRFYMGYEGMQIENKGIWYWIWIQ